VAEQFTEEQLKAIRDRCTDGRTDTRYTVLSQEEMNTLLSAYESANAQSSSRRASRKREKEVRLYDFAKPDRFSKEHLRALQSIHEGFAGELSSELSALYGAPTRVDLLSMDQATYKQYRATVPTKTLLAEVTMRPLISNVLFGVNSSIVGVWVDYLCGGNPNIPATPSDLTPVDIAVATKVLEHGVEVYASSWPGSTQTKPEVHRVADAELCDQSKIVASEAVLVCSFEVQTGAAVGMMTVCIPAVGIEQMMPVVSAVQTNQSSTKRPDPASGETTRALSQVELPCRVVLGTAAVSLSEMTSLDVGDVLRTSKRVGDETEFWVGSAHLFNCRPGNQRGSVAVVISGLAEEATGHRQQAAEEAAGNRQQATAGVPELTLHSNPETPVADVSGLPPRLDPETTSTPAEEEALAEAA
jgi:flagellar motor switch protein FliM